MHALAMASPNAIVTVVEDVGAKLRGQASRAMGVTKLTSAAFASELSARPVMEMIRTPKALSAGRIVRSSSDSPEKEMATNTSALFTMPRSPWAASSACTKNAVVPVEEKVAASFLPTCPDFPTPEKMRFPFALKIRRTA